jgi:pilus assembly protein CpaC
VRVFPDPQAKERLERAYKALEDDINGHFKDCDIRLKVVGDKLVVTGRVRDFVQGGQILRILRANAEAGGDVGRLPVVPPIVPGAITDPTGATNPPPQESFVSAGGPFVINLLEVAGEQQVMLRVIVAEVNRSAARSIGMNFSVTNNQGITVFSNTTGGIGAGGIAVNAGGFGAAPTGFGVANLTATFNAGKIPVAISALKTLSYARSLAEPTLVTMNGVPANFLAGGQYPVPVIGGFGSVNGVGGLQGVAFVPYGVQLNFTPFVTDRDRIRLVLNASVSARDLSAGTNIGGSNVAGLNTRNVSTTVELRQGETLAVAGLIEYNLGGDAQKIPFIGDIPGLNPLTGLQRVTAGEKELVIFITPELVRPLDPNQAVPLPGHEILDPNDIEFYLWGRLEGHCKDYRSPIRTDLSRIKQYYQIETANVFGPTGYTPIP